MEAVAASQPEALAQDRHPLPGQGANSSTRAGPGARMRKEMRVWRLNGLGMFWCNWTSSDSPINSCAITSSLAPARPRLTEVVGEEEEVVETDLAVAVEIGRGGDRIGYT